MEQDSFDIVKFCEKTKTCFDKVGSHSYYLLQIYINVYIEQSKDDLDGSILNIKTIQNNLESDILLLQQFIEDEIIKNRKYPNILLIENIILRTINELNTNLIQIYKLHKALQETKK
jgi:hypothetical protein